MRNIIFRVSLIISLLGINGCTEQEYDYSKPLTTDKITKIKLTEKEELDDYLYLRDAMGKYSTLRCGSEYSPEEQKCECRGDDCYNQNQKAQYLYVMCGLSKKYPSWKKSSIQYIELNPDPQALTKYWVINFNYIYVKHRDECDQYLN